MYISKVLGSSVGEQVAGNFKVNLESLVIKGASKLALVLSFTLVAITCQLLGIASMNLAFADVEVGKQAPEFSALDVDGNLISLTSLKGSYAVLEWSNPGCPFVKKHYYSGNLQRLQKEFVAKGVKWIIVNSSAPGKQGHLSAEEAKEWMKEQEVAGVKMLLDSNGAIGKAFGARATPQLFVLNQQGVVIYSGAIDDDSSASQDSIGTAKNYVAAALNEALGGKPVSVSATDPYGCSVKYGG